MTPRLDETVNLVQMSPDVIKLIYPDVAVSRQPRRAKRTGPKSSGTLLLEPVHIPHEFLDEVRQTRIEILHRHERSLVTVLEMLSPFNKAGDGFGQYRAKRKTILRQKVHLVELDLLVGGKRLPLRAVAESGLLRPALACRGATGLRVYHWALRDPLPTIPIPLCLPDADILIDMGHVFRETYERCLYGRFLFYKQPLTASMSRKDAQWAAEIAIKHKL